MTLRSPRYTFQVLVLTILHEQSMLLEVDHNVGTFSYSGLETCSNNGNHLI